MLGNTPIESVVLYFVVMSVIGALSYFIRHAFEDFAKTLEKISDKIANIETRLTVVEVRAESVLNMPHASPPTWSASRQRPSRP
jgi:hypothetical protein